MAAHIRRLGKDAFAVLGQCEETKELFGITVDPDSMGHMRFVWSFKLKPQTAGREGFAGYQMRGSIFHDENFPGCPYCGVHEFYICNRCQTIVCYHGQQHITCPHCQNSGQIQAQDSFDLSGGGF